MMRPRSAPPLAILLCVAILCSALTTRAQSGFQEFISYPGGDSLGEFQLTMTLNGGVGQLSGLGGTYLIGVDTMGLPQWAETVHFNSNGTGYPATAFGTTPDGGALVKADRAVNINGFEVFAGVALARLQNDGQVVWSKSYLFPDTIPATPSDISSTMSVNADGTTHVLIGCFSGGTMLHRILMLKVSATGTALWGTYLDVPSINNPSLRIQGLSDGGCLIVIGQYFGGPLELQCIRLDASGSLLYANAYDLSNDYWEVLPRGVLEGPGGQCAVVSYRSTSQLNYEDMMWLDQSGSVYRHRFSDWYGEYSGDPKAWQQDVLWLGNRALDSTGAEVLGGVKLVNPGNVGGWTHSFGETSRQWIDSTYWICGAHNATENVFSYLEQKPFLMKVPAWTEFGCRTELIPSAPVDFIDVPDSLMLVTPVNFAWWHTQPDVIDTVASVVPRNPNTVYDFCTLVSVAEEEPQAFVSIWPNPVAQGSVLNVSTTAAAALTIRDVSGRTVLQLNKTNMQLQVSTTGLALGHYLITGSDAHNGVRWTKAFVVQ